MSRLLSISLLIPLIFLGGFKSFSNLIYQEKLPEVYVYVDRISDITAEKAEVFMTTLKEKITKSNLRVEFTPIQNLYLPKNNHTIASISFDPVFDSERIIQDYTVGISANPQSLKEISPVLTNEVGISISISSPIAVEAVYAMLMLSLSRCDLAMPIFTGLKIEESDLSNELHYNIATCHLLQGNYQKSIDLYKDLLYMNTRRFFGTNLAWLYLKIGEENQAFELMSDAIKIARMTDEGVNDLLTARAHLYNLAFRYDDAITDLDTAIELAPDDASLYTLRGRTYLLLYEWDKVAADYNKALELDPTYADAYFYRGVLYYSILQTGQAMYSDALADFQRYLELAPDGEHAAEATRYATDIQTQINALNN